LHYPIPIGPRCDTRITRYAAFGKTEQTTFAKDGKPLKVSMSDGPLPKKDSHIINRLNLSVKISLRAGFVKPSYRAM